MDTTVMNIKFILLYRSCFYVIECSKNLKIEEAHLYKDYFFLKLLYSYIIYV